MRAERSESSDGSSRVGKIMHLIGIFKHTCFVSKHFRKRLAILQTGFPKQLREVPVLLAPNR